MSVDTSTSITRKLRKLYAVTQKNMDLLDRAIVESFVENFPTESTRIHMGRVAPAAPPPVKRGAAKKKKPVKGKGKVNDIKFLVILVKYNQYLMQLFNEHFGTIHFLFVEVSCIY